MVSKSTFNIIVGSLFYYAVGMAYGQAPDTPAPEIPLPETPPNVPPAVQSIFDFIIALKDNFSMADMVAAAVAVGAILGTVYLSFKKKVKPQLKPVASDPPDDGEPSQVGNDGGNGPDIFPVAEEDLTTSRISTLIVGLGGTGKTSLIKAITGDDKADPDIATAKVSTHIVTQKFSGNRETEVTLVDYAGQNLGSLIKAYVDNSDSSEIDLRYGHITSLILVVDIFNPPEGAKKAAKGGENPDGDRIKENIEAWNDQAISAIYGLLDDSMNYVCVFINKSDLLEDINDAKRNRVLKRYTPLSNMLTPYSRGQYLETMFGSAYTGEGVELLKQNLFRYGAKEHDHDNDEIRLAENKPLVEATII